VCGYQRSILESIPVLFGKKNHIYYNCDYFQGKKSFYGKFSKKWKNTKSVGELPKISQNFSNWKISTRNSNIYSMFKVIRFRLTLRCVDLCNQ
jgi:hypothetical protein